MAFAPASSAFSSSSFTTDAGRSTTSPAAMRLATASGRMRMRLIRSVGFSGNCASVNCLEFGKHFVQFGIVDIKRLARDLNDLSEIHEHGGKRSVHPLGSPAYLQSP